MAKKIDMQEMFKTIPELPENFEQYCYNYLPKIPIYYKRNGKISDCICGKCGKVYITDEVPVRNKSAKCPCCGNDGFWEWKKVTRSRYSSHDITVIQCTSSENLVIRAFRVRQIYKQGKKADISLLEKRRLFCTLGDVYKFYNRYAYTNGRFGRVWDNGSDNEYTAMNDLYPGWKEEIKKSSLKYCDTEMIQDSSRYSCGSTVDILLAFANNPALEMYARAGMRKLVDYLVAKEGKSGLINRRGQTLYKQLRLNDKAVINKLIGAEGDPILLEVLQKTKKLGIKLNDEQQSFLTYMYGIYDGKKKTDYLMKYMSLQKLINRIEKYKKQETYDTTAAAVNRYYDYLKMRNELGYDMSNEVFLYPKNLKEKHDQMAAELNARKDELHLQKMLKQYPAIAEKFKSLCKKYSYEDEEYLIRPAKDAAEIVIEGRTLHHCVGRNVYLEKHNAGKTFILMMRKKEMPDEPYCTIEIKGKEILQWYGKDDKKPDTEKIGSWLDAYVGHLKESKRKRVLLKEAV